MDTLSHCNGRKYNFPGTPSQPLVVIHPRSIADLPSIVAESSLHCEHVLLVCLLLNLPLQTLTEQILSGPPHLERLHFHVLAPVHGDGRFCDIR